MYMLCNPIDVACQALLSMGFGFLSQKYCGLPFPPPWNLLNPGIGLIKVGGGIVPFINELPKDTALYQLMTTKPGEG